MRSWPDSSLKARTRCPHSERSSSQTTSTNWLPTPGKWRQRNNANSTLVTINGAWCPIGLQAMARGEFDVHPRGIQKLRLRNLQRLDCPSKIDDLFLARSSVS